MNKRRSADIDLAGMRIVAWPEIAEGFCAFPKKDRQPCKRRAIAMGACTSHIRSLGGHLFVFDCYDPEWHYDLGRERHSFCRACGTVKDERSSVELCPVRRNAPSMLCRTSSDLPTRLQYKFAKPVRETMVIKGKRVNATRHGPFAAYRTDPDAEGRAWEVFHLPSRLPVARLNAEKAGVLLMKRMCDGVELDFTDPMMMNCDSRFHLRCSVIYFRRERCVRVPGGVLTRTAAKPYFLTRKETGFYWQEKGAKIECWGPFGFEIKGSEVLLRTLEEPQLWPLFRAPSRERAVAFSQAAAVLDLNWWTSSTTTEPRWQLLTRIGVGKLMSDFPDVTCLDRELLPELPAVSGRTPVEIFIATTQGPWKVVAYVVAEHFAAHRPLDRRKDGYVLSHVATGHLIGRCKDLRPLLEVALELASAGDWNFMKAEDMPSDLQSQIPEVLRGHGIAPAGSTITIRFVM